MFSIDIELQMPALSFVAINTSGRKPFTLCAHFIQAYRALDTLPTLLLTLDIALKSIAEPKKECVKNQ